MDIYFSEDNIQRLKSYQIDFNDPNKGTDSSNFMCYIGGYIEIIIGNKSIYQNNDSPLQNRHLIEGWGGRTLIGFLDVGVDLVCKNKVSKQQIWDRVIEIDFSLISIDNILVTISNRLEKPGFTEFTEEVELIRFLIESIRCAEIYMNTIKTNVPDYNMFREFSRVMGRYEGLISDIKNSDFYHNHGNK